MHKFIRSKIYDNFFIIYAPLIALLITWVLYTIDSNNFITLGIIISILLHGMGDSTTVLRAYLNKDVLHIYKKRIILTPIFLLFVSYLSIDFFLILFLIEIIWDFHHTALQTWGLGLFYEEKKSKTNEELDKYFVYTTHTIPFIVLYSGLDHISSNFMFLRETPFYLLIKPLTSLFKYFERLIPYLSFVYIIFILYYIFLFFKNKREFSNKYLLYLNTSIAICFFIFFPNQIFLVYITVEIFHGMQSFGLSLSSENSSISDRFLKKNVNWSFIAMLISIMICLFFGYFEWFVDLYVENDFYIAFLNNDNYKVLLTGLSGFLIRLRLIQNFMHYYCDSFIWSRKFFKKKDIN